MKKIFITILFLIIFIPTVSFGADVSFGVDKNIVSIGEDFIVQVFVDTKDVSVNAVEGKVDFPAGSLELKEIRDGNSAINFWVDKPHSTKDGEVSFSGITTGGFTGSRRFLFSLVLHPKQVGKVKLDFSGVQILANDGSGTKIDTKTSATNIAIITAVNNSDFKDLAVKDTNMPEKFNLFIAKDPNTFNGKSFLAFSTVDKGSGIDHYEVRESFWGLGGSYVVSDSPYVLKDQSLMKKVYVKAIDKNGNERIEEIGPQNRLAWLEQFLFIGIILCICIFFIKRIKYKFIH